MRSLGMSLVYVSIYSLKFTTWSGLGYRTHSEDEEYVGTMYGGYSRDQRRVGVPEVACMPPTIILIAALNRHITFSLPPPIYTPGASEKVSLTTIRVYLEV